MNDDVHGMRTRLSDVRALCSALDLLDGALPTRLAFQPPELDRLSSVLAEGRRLPKAATHAATEASRLTCVLVNAHINAANEADGLTGPLVEKAGMLVRSNP